MNERLPCWLAVLAAVAVPAGALYLPFLSNPLVFDDLSFFSGARHAYYATTPFGLDLRLPPYFTLAVTQVLWGTYPPTLHAEIHRALNLAFHFACALALYRFVYQLLLTAAPAPGDEPHRVKRDAQILAVIAAVVFSIHPVAVYGAGYLTQRSIIFATVFSLLSIICFMHGLMRARISGAVAAALLYVLAVFSKEHSLLLPIVAVMTVPLITRNYRFATGYSAVYLLMCLPAAAVVVSIIRGVIGRTYEPGFGLLLNQVEGIPLMDVAGGPWLVSTVTQAGLFFKYFAAWLAPDVGAMSIDVRINFAESWSPAWIVVKVAAFIAFGALGLFLLFRRGRAGVAGYGMLYAWVLFAVEFTSVRFQEPFVLYRSYLWAPGFLIIAAVLLSAFGRRLVSAIAIAACSLLLYQAHDRLTAFSSEVAVWQDAADKLPAAPVPWGSRTLFNLGKAQLTAGQPDLALATSARCIEQYPKTSYCQLARGAIHLRLGEYASALPHLDRALALLPEDGVAHHHRGIALESLGRIDEARDAYREAARLGFAGGDYRLDLLDNPDAGGKRVLYDASRTARKKE